MQRVSCIICAYNEEGRLGAVLDVVSRYPRFFEVIVVDDGSTDATFAEACSYLGVSVLRHETNKGKAAAFALGLEESKGELICMLDADLVGLSFNALDRLLLPCLLGESCMTLSLRGNSIPLVRVPQVDLWSGERVFAARILRNFDFSRVKGYGLETAINICALRADLKIYSVIWPEVFYTKKRHKVSTFSGLLGEYRMVRSIASQYGFGRVVSQYVQFWRRRRRV